MTGDQLTALLAERVLIWRVSPDRFLKGNRRWMPRWQFQPLRRLEHALQVLDKANGQFTLTRTGDGTYTARVSIGDRQGSASGKSKAAAVAVATARAIGIDVPNELLEACAE